MKQTSPNKITFTTPAAACKFSLQYADPQPGPPPDSVADATTMPTLIGYALTWGTTSSDRGGFKARLMPGSAQPDPDGVMAYYNHQDGDVIGNTSNDTLKLEPDQYGLKVSISPPATQAGKDTVTLVKDGYVTGMSFGMYPVEWNDTEEDGKTIRNYSKFTYDEVSVCGRPAFTATSIGLEMKATPHRDAASLRIAEIELQELQIED